ncbi:hypothetical protein [Shewanella holmiensis]|uniref:Uncharacterized protein n=1 Tax=Shewanella holmiensis TaxID=2952222 RepID=A0A9X2WNE7_9GAMM|nr:hypothetical protein [Shewanella holmiensis]MCT7942326.1 hypothetical protein [Shewanella holmiensis]
MIKTASQCADHGLWPIDGSYWTNYYTTSILSGDGGIATSFSELRRLKPEAILSCH